MTTTFDLFAQYSPYVKKLARTVGKSPDRLWIAMAPHILKAVERGIETTSGEDAVIAYAVAETLIAEWSEEPIKAAGYIAQELFAHDPSFGTRKALEYEVIIQDARKLMMTQPVTNPIERS